MVVPADAPRAKAGSARVAGALIGLFALVVAAISIVVFGHHHSHAPVVAPAPPPVRTLSTVPLRPVALSVAPMVSPDTVAQSATSVYTLRSSEQGTTLVARYDVRTSRLAATISLAGAQDFSLTPAALFVLRAPPISRQGTVSGAATVAVLAPGPLRVERTFPVSTLSPLRIVVLGDAAWVMGFDGVKRYDTTSGRLLGAVDLRAERCPSGGSGQCTPLANVSPYDIAFDPASQRVFVAWQSGQSLGLTELRADTTPVTEGYPLGGSRINAKTATRALAVGAGSVFVESDATSPMQWREFNSGNLAAPPTATVQGSNALKLRRSGSDVWTVDEVRSVIACLDPGTGQTRWRGTVDNPVEVAAINNELFVFTATTVERARLPTACR